MTERSDELMERLGSISDASGTESLWWRPSLGQATFDLLAAGKQVTTGALIERLEESTRPENLVHKKLSAKAAISVLKSLAEERTAEIELPPAP